MIEPVSPNAEVNALISKIAVLLASGLIKILPVPVPRALADVVKINEPLFNVVVPVKPVLAAEIVKVPVPNEPPIVKLPAPDNLPAEPKVMLPPDFTVTVLDEPVTTKLLPKV